MAKLRKLGRRTDHRQAMLRNQVQSLLENGRITTTVTRAKETQRMTDKMITLGKKGNLHAKRQAMAYLYRRDILEKLFVELAPKYSERNGGYTRVIKLGPRRGDGSEMAILELV
jgi:large subunit ribosomal protein L17